MGIFTRNLIIGRDLGKIIARALKIEHLKIKDIHIQTSVDEVVRVDIVTFLTSEQLQSLMEELEHEKV